MRKHTPGPWFVNGHETYTKYVEARIGAGLLQEVAACGPTEQQEQQEANARLIAAAPELLDALVNLLPLISPLKAESQQVADASAAIAKATA
ncbi:hypothetical protein JEV04_15400 [Pseudomonas aeruginosa]|nr:hypothetical protein [Pseudomonas aeruginosa]